MTDSAYVLGCLYYQVKQTSLPKFGKFTGTFVNNQFGPEELEAKKPAQLWVAGNHAVGDP